MSTQKRLFSGVQPSGELHIGNYLGAIRNWVALQSQFECLFVSTAHTDVEVDATIAVVESFFAG